MKHPKTNFSKNSGVVGAGPDIMKARMALARSHKSVPAMGKPKSMSHPGNKRVMAQTGMKKMPY